MNIAKVTTSATFRAMSAATAMPYPAAMAEQLDKMGFASNLWLSERQMTSLGIAVAPDQVTKGFFSMTKLRDGVDYALYNSEQTTDPAKVEALKGRMVATNALTKPRETLSNGNKLTSESEEFKDVTNPETVAFGSKMYPVSASSGRFFSKTMVLPLLRAAVVNKYTSPFWITLSEAENLGLKIGNVEAGVEVALSNASVMTFFNAEQTDNAVKVATVAYNAQFQPRSAVSGTPYPEPARTALTTAALKYRHSSVYWLTSQETTFVRAEITAGQEPTEVTTPGGLIRVFNASQTNHQDAIEVRLKTLF